MLDSRAQHLLKTLIERYIVDGQPVGSRVLSRQSGLELSPATIRNVMADLEEMGFIASPHTSAGRIPTAKGYRFFVDSLLVVKPLNVDEINELQDQLQVDRPQALVTTAATLLSHLTLFAGVVATPRFPRTTTTWSYRARRISCRRPTSRPTWTGFAACSKFSSRKPRCYTFSTSVSTRMACTCSSAENRDSRRSTSAA